MEFDLNTFKAGLVNGLGLTFTCENMGYDPREVSEYLKRNPSVMKDCQNAVSTSFKAYLSYSNKLLTEKKFGQWMNQGKNLREFVGKIVLWEQHCTAAEAEDPYKVTAAFHLYQTTREVATACGLTLPQLVDKILANDALKAYLRSNGFFM